MLIRSIRTFLIAFFATFYLSSFSAQITQGYSPEEAKEMLKINFRFVDSMYWDSFPAPERFSLKYRSKTVGFDNKWDFWEDNSGVGVFNIRGTTGSLTSWGSNFYSAMIPAVGWIKIAEKDTFRYALADNPKATVHVGWTTSLGCMWKDIESQLNTFIASGKRQLFVTGHSQGGAIAYLLTAQLRMLQQVGKLPSDLVIKTYCAAAPKPGNLYFAYDYESKTQGGWAFNTVNALDWVPESPFTVHTTEDFNAINPFSDAKKSMKSLPFFPRLYLKHAFNQMDKPTRKAQRKFEKYLGRKISKVLSKSLKGFETPVYVASFAYVRCGQHVILTPKDDYLKLFQQDPQDKFLNHGIEPYLFLLNQLRL